jgi:hypothetical protein
MNAEAMAEALMLEAEAWEAGQRDARRISGIWCEEFHAHAVAKRALELLNIAG